MTETFMFLIKYRTLHRSASFKWSSSWRNCAIFVQNFNPLCVCSVLIYTTSGTWISKYGCLNSKISVHMWAYENNRSSSHFLEKFHFSDMQMAHLFRQSLTFSLRLSHWLPAILFHSQRFENELHSLVHSLDRVKSFFKLNVGGLNSDLPHSKFWQGRKKANQLQSWCSYPSILISCIVLWVQLFTPSTIPSKKQVKRVPFS